MRDWQPARWTAKLRAMMEDERLLVLRTTMGTGHLGETAFGESRKHWAERYTFVLMTLGLADDAGAAVFGSGPIAPVAAQHHVGPA